MSENINSEINLTFSEVEPLWNALYDKSKIVCTAALHVLVRLPLDKEVWLKIGHYITELLSARLEANVTENGQQSFLEIDRRELIEAAAYVPIRQVRSILHRIVQEGTEEERSIAAYALSKAHDSVASSQLILEYSTLDGWSKEMAAMSLCRIDSSLNELALQELFQNEQDIKLRLWLAVALAKIGKPDAILAVFEEIELESYWPFWGDPNYIYSSLEQIGRLPEVSIKSLRSFYEDREKKKSEICNKIRGIIYVLIKESDSGSTALSSKSIPEAPDLKNIASLKQKAKDLAQRIQNIQSVSECRKEMGMEDGKVLYYLEPEHASTLVKELFSKLEKELGYELILGGNWIVDIVNSISTAFTPDIEGLFETYLLLTSKGLRSFYLFSWDEIIGNDIEVFTEFLKNKYNYCWIQTARIEKIDDGNTIKISDGKKSLFLRLNDEKTMASIEIDNVRIAELIARIEHGKLNIYPSFNDISCGIGDYEASNIGAMNGIRMQIAWTVSRAGLHQVFISLREKLATSDEIERFAAIWLIREAFLYLRQSYPPHFGGGVELEDISPPQPDLLFDESDIKCANFSPVMEKLEPVLLGVSAPPSIKPGGVFISRFVAYVKALEEKVKQELFDLSRGKSENLMGLESCRWKTGTHVTVKLSGEKYLSINPPEREFIWSGTKNRLDFKVEVLGDAPEGSTILMFDVFIDGIKINPTSIGLEFEISSKAQQQEKEKFISVEPARTAFASYSSLDKDRVLDRLASVRISAGLDIFLDCLSLRPGDEWKSEIAQKIKSRDIFLLFWSKNAINSEWVTWEWKTALESESKIQIHPLQSVLEAPPPDELKKFHFGDIYMTIRDSQRRNN